MGLGSFINKITGASNTAKQSYTYSSWLASQQSKYQKEAMQNAHQWEVGDLEKAGLNPVLSAGGSGANAGGVGGGGTIGASSGAGGLSSLLTSGKELLTLSAELNKIIADTENVETQTEATKALLPHNINNVKADTAKKQSEEYVNENTAPTRLLNDIKSGVNSMVNSAKNLINKAPERKPGKNSKGQATYSKSMLLG